MTRTRTRRCSSRRRFAPSLGKPRGMLHPRAQTRPRFRELSEFQAEPGFSGRDD
jgi:hypothetical protein